MSNDIKTEYRGVEITYFEGDGSWRAMNSDLRDDRLSRLKAKIDDSMKASFAQTECFIRTSSWNGFFSKSVATSYVAEGKGSFWLTDEKGRRSKQSADLVFSSSLRNLASIDEIAKCEAAVEVLRKKVNGLSASLDPLPVPMQKKNV